MIYSFRAECNADIDLFLKSAKEQDIVIESAQIIPDKLFPDSEIKFESVSSLNEIQVVLNGCLDSHVMLETLRPVALVENSLERDRSISEKSKVVETNTDITSLSLTAKIALNEHGEEKCIACCKDYEVIHDTDALAKKYGVHVDFILSLVNAGDELQQLKLNNAQ